MKLPTTYYAFALIGITLGFTSCDKYFEFSPYGAYVHEDNRNTTAKNLQLIQSIQTDPASFKFAIVADNHYHYNNLKTVIDDINKRDDVVFVVFGGDITDQALLKEFQVFYDAMKNLHKPYLTVIGNHDYKSNGAVIYKQMFGDCNYSFEFNGNKFVIFDDVVWESTTPPDFSWLSVQLNDNSSYKQVFVIAHIPPFADQFDSVMEEQYKTLMSENNVKLSLHGHVHDFSFGKAYEDNVDYLTVPWIKKLSYCIINVCDKSFEIELIEL